MMKKWKYALMTAATALLIPAFASRAEMPPIGMPNPLVEYKTYHSLAEATDSVPLFLPKGTLLAGQCHLTDYIAIGGKLSDIRYRMDDGSTLSVRTARLVGEEAGKNISGVYTGRWESRMIGATEVMTAKTMDGSLAAFWTEGEYAFSVVGSKMSDDVFNALLSDVFVDMSEHFYGEAANPLARKTF